MGTRDETIDVHDEGGEQNNGIGPEHHEIYGFERDKLENPMGHGVGADDPDKQVNPAWHTMGCPKLSATQK